MMTSRFVVFILIVDIEEKYGELKQMTEASVLRRNRKFVEHISGLSLSRRHYNVSATLVYTVTSFPIQGYYK
jgi:hypothetical protein